MNALEKFNHALQSLPLIAILRGIAPTEALEVGQALHDETTRFAAVLTFAVTASGITLVGVGAAFWGLVAGLIALGLDKWAGAIRS